METVLEVVCKAGQKVFALSVAGNHLHLLVEPAGEPFGCVVSRYKNTVRKAIEADGFAGQLWTMGFDKRYCNSTEELICRIRYIGRHENSLIFVSEGY